MKNKILLLIPLLLSFIGCSNKTSSTTIQKESTSTSNQMVNKNVDVIVLCGQSNAEGHTWTNELIKNIDKTTAKKYINGFDNFKIRFNCSNGLNKNNDFSNVKLGEGVSVNQFGPEIGICDYLDSVHSYLENDIYIIKYAVGGTSLYYNWRSTSSSNENNNVGDLYTNLINYIDESIDLLKNQDLIPNIKAICWMQGESDSNSMASSFYEELENNFINDLSYHIEEKQNTKVSFLSAGISNCPNWDQYYKVINTAKYNNSLKDNEYRYYIDTIKEKLEYSKEPISNPDINHYDSLSMIKLGNLFAKTLFDNAII